MPDFNSHFSPLNPAPPQFIIECNTHISKSNQQPMDRTKFP